MDENNEFWLLWRIANSQWRTDLNGIVGLDYTAVSVIANGLDIELTPCVMRKLEVLEDYMIGMAKRK